MTDLLKGSVKGLIDDLVEVLMKDLTMVSYEIYLEDIHLPFRVGRFLRKILDACDDNKGKFQQ